MTNQKTKKNKRLGKGIFSRVTSLIKGTIRSSLPNSNAKRKSIIRKGSKKSVSFLDKNKKPKKVKINTPENMIKEYTLNTSEIKYKADKIRNKIPKCGNNNNIFPCKKHNTIFYIQDEFDEYIQLKNIRNQITQNKSRKQHYNDISNVLNSQGSQLLRNTTSKNKKSSIKKL